MTDEADAIPFRVTLGHLEDDSLNLRFPPEYGEQLLALLDEQGIDHNTAAEFAAGPVEWIEVVKVFGIAGGGGLSGLALVLNAFFHRNRHKRFRVEVNGTTTAVDATGLSEPAIRRLLQGLPAQQAAHDEETRRRMGPSSSDHGA